MDKSKGISDLKLKDSTVKIMCSNKDLGRAIIGKLAFDGIEAKLIEEQVDIAYLDAKDELEATKLLAVAMSEIYLENSFLIGQYNYLHALLSDRTKKLQAKPLDISLTTEIKKISNDLEIIEPAMRKVNAVIFTHLEKKHGNGLRFAYAKTL